DKAKEIEKELAFLHNVGPGDSEAKEREFEAAKEQVEAGEQEINTLKRDWQAQSVLGRVGKLIEPAVEPLGWDWRIGMAAIASFPAREVMVGTLGIIFGAGEVEGDDTADLQQAMHAARWDGQPERRVFSVPVALSVMVFFALCCQCVSTLVVIK